MGTRSLTVVQDAKGSEVLTFYRHYDGYPTGHGRELMKFLNGYKFSCHSTITPRDNKVANGVGCLAAQLVAHFKRPRRLWHKAAREMANQFYIMASGTRDVWEEYIYVVTEKDGAPFVQVLNASSKLLMEGTPKEVQRLIRLEAQKEKRERAKA